MLVSRINTNWNYYTIVCLNTLKSERKKKKKKCSRLSHELFFAITQSRARFQLRSFSSSAFRNRVSREPVKKKKFCKISCERRWLNQFVLRFRNLHLTPDRFSFFITRRCVQTLIYHLSIVIPVECVSGRQFLLRKFPDVFEQFFAESNPLRSVKGLLKFFITIITKKFANVSKFYSFFLFVLRIRSDMKMDGDKKKNENIFSICSQNFN